MKSWWRSFQWWRINRAASFPKIKESFAWQRILLVLYYGSAQSTYFSRGLKGGIDSDHPLVKDYNIQPRVVESSLKWLEKQKLIEVEKGSSQNFVLTEKGFTVAMDIEKNMLSEKIQIGVASFSGLLLFVTAMQVIIAALEMKSLPIGLLLIAIFVICFVVMAIYFTRLIQKGYSL